MKLQSNILFSPQTVKIKSSLHFVLPFAFISSLPVFFDWHHVLIAAFHRCLTHLHLHLQSPRETDLDNRYLPLQAKDAVEEGVLWHAARHDKHAAQHVEVEVVFRQRTRQSGLEEGCPSFLESQTSSPVPLR